MKKLTRALLILSVLFLSSCESTDDKECSLIECISSGISFEFVDKETGENLLKNESLDPSDIEIKVPGVEPINFRYENYSNSYILLIQNWPNGLHQLSILVNSNSIFEMELETEWVRGECCSSTEIRNLVVTKGEYIQGEEDEFFQIQL
ncbi:hypothetical protein GCM10023115_36440 [Pontixanthobacter gangjinensis]|uniref:Lipoprotein n=1 Tax=Christiangramia aestuarii TaxID=1028746 RepID=A0A7K1LQV4_9FLAO|nr:hypothetical protein [Christiangramia aestuarii]MUP43189.1 hypothetical protein [Christiangramia aestuarii]